MRPRAPAQPLQLDRSRRHPLRHRHREPFLIGTNGTRAPPSSHLPTLFTPPVRLSSLAQSAVLACLASCLLAIVRLDWIVFASGLAALAPLLRDGAVHLSQGGVGGVHTAGWDRAPAAAPSATSATTSATTSASASAAGATPTALGRRVGRGVGRACGAVRMLRNVLARVPDATDVAHRHFCKVEQIIEDEAVLAHTTGTADTSAARPA
jgi:hypothetical protein